MKTPIKVGDYVKSKTKKGKVYQIDHLGQIIVQSHNGMKPSTHLFLPHQLTPITREEFQSWCAKKGHTSIINI